MTDDARASPPQSNADTLMPMLWNSRLQAWMLTLLCVTLLVGRVGGAHLHLCFDGRESPSSFHLFDIGLHQTESGLDTPHEDVDVAVSDELLSKNKFEWSTPLVLLAAIVVFGFLRAPRRFVSLFITHAIPAAPPFLLPPLRGPPALTSL